LTRTAIEGDKKNMFTIASSNEASYTHVRLNIFPDGGISRVHVLGVRVPEPIELAVAALIEEDKAAEQIAVVDELKVVETETMTKSTPAAVSKAPKAPKASKAAKKEVVAVVVEKKQEVEEVKEEVVAVEFKSKGTELTSEISSVSTLVDETEASVLAAATTGSKKGATKRGRPSKANASAAGAAAAIAVVAATKLAAGAGSKKKAKGRSASVLDEEEETASEVSVGSAPRSKKARE